MPAAEICDGVDDDCNGAIDDDLADEGTPCDITVAGVGTCTGAQVCQGAAGWACVGPTPEPEVCDFQDNDCDGTTDEDFKDALGEWTLDEHCGGCGNDCTSAIPNGTGACNLFMGEPRCEVLSCDTGYFQDGPLVCRAVTSNECQPCLTDDDCPTPGDLCLDLDGGKYCGVDCSPGNLHDPVALSCPVDYVCTDLGGGVEQCVPDSGSCSCLPVNDGMSRACAQTNVNGTCYGTEVCDPAVGWTGCTAAVPAAEICDGVDNDCDGATDEGFNVGDVCIVGLGVCQNTGNMVCTGDGTGTECSATAGSGVPEDCNGLDDDCDGQTDDAVDLNPIAPDCVEQDGVCLGSKQTCGGASGWLACTGPEYGADYEAFEITCDGKDNDCDGSPDNGLPAPPCASQQGVCSGTTEVCSGALGWQACGPAEYGPDYEPVEATCDYQDNDCDGATDEGYFNTQGTGDYDTDTSCGNCFTDCTTIYAKPDAYGQCNVSGSPVCEMICCTIGDPDPACDGIYDYLDANGIPDDGCEFHVDAGAYHVSETTGTDDGTCGAWDTPCQTINWGLARASADSITRVDVASGAYYEQVDLFAGIDLYGGYNPVTWGRDPASNPTVVYGTSGAGHRYAVVASDITTPTIFDGFVVYGENAGGTAENSYGIYIYDSDSNLEISNNVIWGGDGGPGFSGSSGADGASGPNGSNGLDAYEPAGAYDCWETCAIGAENPGGASGANTCGGLNVRGGSGGRADCPDFNETVDMCAFCDATESQTVTTSGETAPNGGGGGGVGGCDGMVDYFCQGSCSCYMPADCTQLMESARGDDGSSGTHGGAGSGCNLPEGTGGGGDWAGVAGTDGAAGDHGRGGGGGGAGGGTETDNDANCANDGWSDIGGSGGGGGGGGCGGGIGQGGEPGGGSFGIFVVFSVPPVTVPDISGNEIHRGFGGSGGSGGPGGVGGSGSAGGLGGAGGVPGSSSWCAAPGAGGGYGGDGGHGGGGGGGCGGASYGIFSWGQGVVSLASWIASNTFMAGGGGGADGAGGGSGAGGNPGTYGLDGASGNTNF